MLRIHAMPKPEGDHIIEQRGAIELLQVLTVSRGGKRAFSIEHGPLNAEGQGRHKRELGGKRPEPRLAFHGRDLRRAMMGGGWGVQRGDAHFNHHHLPTS